MSEKVFFAACLVVGLTISGLLDAHDPECRPEGSEVKFADCKPMTRVEVKARADKPGNSATGVGACPHLAVARKTIELLECPG